MPVSLSPELFKELRLSANMAMWRAWDAAHPAGTRVDEVKCIQNLVRHALPDVDSAWKDILGAVGIQASLAGVVCHGRPHVDYGATKACELGDLMLVHDHWLHPSVQERRAAIIQAKVFGPGGVTSKNHVQLDLYQRWPRFTYMNWPGGLTALTTMLAAQAGISPGTPGALERDVFVSTPHPSRAPNSVVDAGARYGMIDTGLHPWARPWFSKNPWRLCSPNAENLYHHTGGLTLGGYLVRMMTGDAGRKVPSPGWPKGLAGACHWSLVVEEILSLLPPTPSVTAASLPAGAVTTSGGNTAFISAPPPSRTARNPPPPDDSSVQDEEGAFAVIHLTTHGWLEDRG